MLSSNVLAFGALLATAGKVTAETAPGFPVRVSTTLEITYGSNEVSPPGELLPRSDVLRLPTLDSPVWVSNENGPVKGILLMVDSDVPRNGTRVELLHWLATNVTNDFGENSPLVVANNTAPAPYIPPTPPGGDIAHAYSFVVFRQPENFTIPAAFQDVLQTRVFFNTSAFMQAAGLNASHVIAGNYMRVQNTTDASTTTFPPPRPTNVTEPTPTLSPPIPFPGVASILGGGGMSFWTGVVGAAVVGFAAFAL